MKEEWEAARDSVHFQYTVAGMTVPKSVTRVTVDPSDEHIPENAFRDCTSLVEVQLHEALRSIGVEAFRNCMSLPRIKIPSSVTDIGDWAFDDCTGLVEVQLHEGLRSIWAGAFMNCTSLHTYSILSHQH